MYAGLRLWGFIVVSQKVKNAMDQNSVQFVIKCLFELNGILTHPFDANKDIPFNAFSGSRIVECYYVGKRFVIEVGDI